MSAEPEASVRILCVDDDPSILAGFQRTLRRLAPVDVAPTGGDALQMAEAFGPYAVVIADMQMPGMDGITVLNRIHAISPNTVRLMLTGDHDQKTAIEAVNQGRVYRFLSKPCPAADLERAVVDALHHHRVSAIERDLLQQTFAGSIRILVDILGAIDQHAFGASPIERDLLRRLCSVLGIIDFWPVEIAAMLANLGRVTIPPAILLKAQAGTDLLSTEREMLDQIPEVSARLLASIPRLDPVIAIIRYHRKRWDGGGLPAESIHGEAIPLGARILHVLADFHHLRSQGLGQRAALGVMSDRPGCYDPSIMDALVRILPTGSQKQRGVHQIPLQELVPGMVLLADVETITGQKLVHAGQAVTPVLIDRLHNFARVTPLKEPLTIETFL